MAVQDLAPLSLQTVLDPLLDQALAAHPDIQVRREDFAPFAMHCLRASVGAVCSETGASRKLHIEDLYLAYAFAVGCPSAHQIMENRHLVPLRRRLQRMGVPAAEIAEIVQDLCCRLIEMASGARPAYEGRGSLGGWLFIAATRKRQRQITASRRQTPMDAAALEARQPGPASDPEIGHLLRLDEKTLRGALQAALPELSPGERNLLRHHFLSHLSIDRLADIYQIHRATAARRLRRAQLRLSEAVRAQLAVSAPESAESLPRLFAHHLDRHDLGLAAALGATLESEAP